MCFQGGLYGRLGGQGPLRSPDDLYARLLLEVRELYAPEAIFPVVCGSMDRDLYAPFYDLYARLRHPVDQGLYVPRRPFMSSEVRVSRELYAPRATFMSA
jgi:hypothetical protein